MKNYFIYLTFLIGSSYAFTQDLPIESFNCPWFNSYKSSVSSSFLNSYDAQIGESGSIVFENQPSSSFGKLSDHFTQLGISQAYNFVNTSTTDNTLLPGSVIKIYQEYYNGILVEGGGYTENITNKPSGDPCIEVYFISTNIITGINANTNPDYTKFNAVNKLREFLGISLNDENRLPQ